MSPASCHWSNITTRREVEIVTAATVSFSLSHLFPDQHPLLVDLQFSDGEEGDICGSA